MGKAKRPATPKSSKSTAPDVPTATGAAAGIGATWLITAPPSDLNKLVKRTSWESGEIIHRVHPDVYTADQFNPGLNGNARFSPICDAAGNPIPTIYGGTTFECAVMETVFHDVPFAAGLKTVARRKIRHHHYSQLISAAELTLANLSNKALRKLGIPRVDLIDTEKDLYPQTRKWAEAIHAQCLDVQGLCWVSRQDHTAQAIILFGDRLAPGLLSLTAPSVDLVGDDATYAGAVKLADDIGVKIIGK
ncbi:RES family NAD+ phosphorylase [Sphingobium sp.]|uniref:RES family NAD+ phosphorylase n=1 Tax=Sphingobium sp. TaxID=1912891 RepID=UPI0028BEC125|nr:RES family NAD+ phosphorylase [Sphingobium sp.]